MTNNRFSKTAFACAGIFAAGLLTGCSGGTTYGTGVTQEAQLAQDLTSLVTIGSGERKKPINYESRPKLVKAPTTGTLPAPAETVESQDAYFPENPESVRARLRQDATENFDENGVRKPVSPRLAALREESAARNKSSTIDFNDNDNKTSPREYIEINEAFKKRKAERITQRAASGPAKRKYLTQPPDEYRTPAETAAVGTVGEEEKDPNAQKPKTNYNPLKGIFGG